MSPSKMESEKKIPRWRRNDYISTISKMANIETRSDTQSNQLCYFIAIYNFITFKAILKNWPRGRPYFPPRFRFNILLHDRQQY